jgi:hypothetical protein
LDGDGSDPGFYIPSASQGIFHAPYVMQQTKAFLEEKHFYNWAFTEFKEVVIGRLEPAFISPGSGGPSTYDQIVVGGDNNDIWTILNEKKSLMKGYLSINQVTLRLSDFTGMGKPPYTIMLVDVKKKLHQLTPDRSKGKKSGGKITKKEKSSDDSKKSRSAVKKQVYGGKKPLLQSKITF